MRIPNATRYAITFAADCEAALVARAMYTATFENFAACVGHVADTRNQEPEVMGRDFYPVAFAEQAAQCFNRLVGTGEQRWINYGENLPEELLQHCLDAGQAECDSLACVK